MAHTSWILPGADDQPILGDTHLPDGEPIGVLVVCHGFKGYKDYGFFPYLAECAAQRGLIAHRFNFSHSGMTDRLETFERPKLFEQDTWGKQTEDLGRVAAAIATGQLAGRDFPQVWFGHSRGGVTVLLTAGRVFAAADYQGANRVPPPPDVPAPVAVVTASTPDVATSLDDAQRRLMHKQGYLESPSSRTGQNLRVGLGWLKEIEANPRAYDPCRAIARIKCPVLILHGDQDETVSPTAARRLAEAGGDRVNVRIIEGANHVYGGRNPLPNDEPPPAALQEMVDLTIDFAAQRCRGVC